MMLASCWPGFGSQIHSMTPNNTFNADRRKGMRLAIRTAPAQCRRVKCER
jgi:hypothetical protein